MQSRLLVLLCRRGCCWLWTGSNIARHARCVPTSFSQVIRAVSRARAGLTGLPGRRRCGRRAHARVGAVGRALAGRQQESAQDTKQGSELATQRLRAWHSAAGIVIQEREKHLFNATLRASASNGLRGEPRGPGVGWGLSQSAARWADGKPREGGAGAPVRPPIDCEFADSRLHAVPAKDMSV